MPVVTTEVGNTRSELAEADDSLIALPGWELCVPKRANALANDIGIAPPMAALQAAHDLPRVIIESGVYYVTHVYNAIKVYRQVKLRICGEYPLSAASAKAGSCPESATSGRFLPINAVFPTNGRFYSTGDINSR
jgi:hypothetical protein